jgi:hypothetical protein
MSTTLLTFFACIALIATFLGPILLIWRLRSVKGLLCAMLWFWVVLFLWFVLCDSIVVLDYARLNQPRPGAVDEDGGFIFLILFIWGFLFGPIYCILLSVPIAIEGTLKEIEAKKRRK